MRLLCVLIVLATSATAHAKSWFWQQSGMYLHDVAVAPDGSIATFANAELLRFSADGKVRSKRAFPATSLVSAVEFAPDGELVVAGYFEKTIDLGGGELTGDDRDGFVARYKTDGKLRWAVQIRASTFVHVRDVAAIGDRVLAVGTFRGKAKLGTTTLDSKSDDRGVQLLLDAEGKVLVFEEVQAELAAACATRDGFVTGGRTRDADKDDAGFVRALDLQGKTRWSYSPTTGEVSGAACRADGTSFVATDNDDDVAVLELDATGKLVRTLPIVTAMRDKPLSITASATEVAVTTRHNDDGPVVSRVTRFGAKGKLVSAQDYKAAETVWVRAAYRGKTLVLAGEVQRGAKIKIAGKALIGPAVFVSAP